MKNPMMILALSCLTLVALGGTINAQEDIKSLADPAFEHPRRGPVPFNHEKHNAAAKLQECQACHHAYKGGKLDPGADSVGSKCSECHPVKAAKGKTPLMRAYHRQCQTCHEQRGAGPVTCGQCHPRNGVKQ